MEVEMKRLLLTCLMLLETQIFAGDSGGYASDGGYATAGAGTFVVDLEDADDAQPLTEADLSKLLPSPPETPNATPQVLSLDLSDAEIMAWLKTKRSIHGKKQKGNIRFKWMPHPLDPDSEVVDTKVREIPPVRERKRIEEMGDMHGLVQKKLTPEGQAQLKPWMTRDGIDWNKAYYSWQPAPHVQERELSAGELAEALLVDQEWTTRRQERRAEKDAALPRKQRARLENALLQLPEEQHAAETERMLKIFEEELLLEQLINELTRNQAAVIDVLEQLAPDETVVERN